MHKKSCSLVPKSATCSIHPVKRSALSCTSKDGFRKIKLAELQSKTLHAKTIVRTWRLSLYDRLSWWLPLWELPVPWSGVVREFLTAESIFLVTKFRCRKKSITAKKFPCLTRGNDNIPPDLVDTHLLLINPKARNGYSPTDGQLKWSLIKKKTRNPGNGNGNHSFTSSHHSVQLKTPASFEGQRS